MQQDLKTLGTDFFTFLSVNYGTGNMGFDLSVVGFLAVGAIIIVAIMQAVSLGRSHSGREAELLADVSELLHEMNIQMHELRSDTHQEFTKAVAELEYIRRQLQALNVEEIWRSRIVEVPIVSTSDSLIDLFQ